MKVRRKAREFKKTTVKGARSSMIKTHVQGETLSHNIKVASKE